MYTSTPADVPDPPFRFFEGLVPRLHVTWVSLTVLYPPGPLLGHSSHPLSDYEYVYQCRKFSTEVRVVLVENVAMETSTCSRKEVEGAPGLEP